MITIPAYFNDNAKRATVIAGQIAGFTVLTTISEPTAASLAYINDFGDLSKPKIIVVFDWGGGTLDTSLLKVTPVKNNLPFVEVIATSGDNLLGGRDLDENLLKFIINKCKEEKGIDISPPDGQTNDNFEWREQYNFLKGNVEKFKRELSGRESIQANLRFNFQAKINQMWKYKITRQEFNEANSKEYSRCIDILQKLFAEDKVVSNRITKNIIDEVVLVGGSSKIPKIQELIKGFFPGKPVHYRLSPDLVVAQGAAVLASRMISDSKAGFSDVISQDIGVEVIGDDQRTLEMGVVIPRNSPYPFEQSKRFTTVRIKQDVVDFKVLQGNFKDASKCSTLARSTLSGWKNPNFERATFEITMNLDPKMGQLKSVIQCLTDDWKEEIITKSQELLVIEASGEEIDKSRMKIVERMEGPVKEASEEDIKKLEKLLNFVEETTTSSVYARDARNWVRSTRPKSKQQCEWYYQKVLEKADNRKFLEEML